jgi:hypothetical protein
MIVRMAGRKFYATSPALWDLAIDKAEKPLK